MDRYLNTVPYFICEETYASCINDNPNNAEGQQICTDDEDQFCSGYQNASDHSQVTITSLITLVTTISGSGPSTSIVALQIIEPTSIALASSAATSSATRHTSSTVTSPAASASTGAPPSHLSKGALAAAIAVPVAVVFLAVILGFVVFKQRQRRRAQRQAASDQPSDGWDKKELHAESIPRKELPASARYELSGNSYDNREEMAADHSYSYGRRAEMAAREPAADELDDSRLTSQTQTSSRDLRQATSGAQPGHFTIPRKAIRKG